MHKLRKIVLLGAGNVATQLGIALHDAGFTICQVYSRTAANADQLARRLDAEHLTAVKDITPDADLYILSVPDDAIVTVASALPQNDRFLVHTSGSVPMDALQAHSNHFGVIYPVQTFSKERHIDFSHLPVCIEANTLTNLERLNQLVSHITYDVRAVPSEKRKVLHLAAVFACNFPNYLYAVAESLVAGVNLDFDLLKPLILETAEKVQQISPGKAQTGPAMRGDERVLAAHLELLEKHPALKKLYSQMSEEIYRMKKK